MRKVIFDLDSSYLEQKALMPRKESSKHRVLEPGKKSFGKILETGWYFSDQKVG